MGSFVEELVGEPVVPGSILTEQYLGVLSNLNLSRLGWQIVGRASVAIASV